MLQRLDKIQAPVRQAFYITLIVLLTLLGAYLVYRLSQILIVLFAAIILASAIRPVVDRLERLGLRRGAAILLIYVVIIAIIGGLLVIAVPPMANFLVQMSQEGLMMGEVRMFAARLAFFGWDQFNLPVVVLTLPTQLQTLIGEASNTAQQQVRRQMWPFARTTLVVVSQILLGLVMGYYWLVAREQTLALLLKMSPSKHRKEIKRMWDDIETALGAYVRGQTLLIATVGGFSFVALFLLGVPYPLPLAVVAALMEVIPFVGPLLGAIPAVLLAFTVSPITALLVIGLYTVFQQVESNVLVPKVMEKSVGLNPLLVILALIAGGVLNGAVGALLAIPVAGALQVIARHLWITPTLMKNGAVDDATDSTTVAEESVEEAQPEKAVSTVG